MRGYYALYGKRLYELNKVVPGCEVIPFRPNHYDKHSWNGDGSLDLDVHLSNFDIASKSNKEAVEQVIEYIQKYRLTSLKQLSDEYAMYLQFAVVDNKSKEQIDSAILATHFKMRTGIFPLGITDENEYVCRFALATPKLMFARQYRETAPLGLRVKQEKSYTILLQRIQITQLLVSSFAEVPVSDGGNMHRTDIDPVNHPHVILPHHNCHHHGHPSIHYVAGAPHLSNKYEIVIYDTEITGARFDPVVWDRKLTAIRFNVEIELNNIAVAADKRDINLILKENINRPEEPVDPEPLPEPEEPSVIVPYPPVEDGGSDEGLGNTSLEW